jgi:hypothetical protein
LLSLAVIQCDPEIVELLLDYGELPQTPCGPLREMMPAPGDWVTNINKVLRCCRFLSRCGCVPATRITAETPERFRAIGHTAVHHAADLMQDHLKYRMNTVWCRMSHRQAGVFKGLTGNGVEHQREADFKEIEDAVEEDLSPVRNVKPEVSGWRDYYVTTVKTQISFVSLW